MNHLTRLLPRTGAVLVLFCLGLSQSASACSKAHVRELSEGGKSVAQIAKLCDLTSEQVGRILDGKPVDTSSSSSEDDDAEEEEDEGLPKGTVLVECGCWGYVSIGAGQPNSDCKSGQERAVSCPGWCPAGGSPWKRVCR